MIRITPRSRVGRMQIRRTSWLLVTALTLIGVSSCSRSFDQVSPRRSTRGTITRADLDGTSYLSAHHAVQILRPRWLRRYGTATRANPNPLPIVYVDGMRRGTVEELHRISAGDVETISFLSPTDATTPGGPATPREPST